MNVGLTHVSSIEGQEQRILRVHNRGEMPLQAGDSVNLGDSYCRHMVDGCRPYLVVENSAGDPVFSALPATRDLGIGAYMGVPLYRSDGSLYGTLCALHPEPRRAQPGEVELLTLAGRIVAQAFEAEENRLAERRMARAALEQALVQEQEARARAEGALRQRNDFLTRAAHELRTPLTILQLQVDVLRRKMEADTAGTWSDALTQLGRQTRRLARVADDLVSASRMDAELPHRAVEPVDLAVLTQEVVAEFRSDVTRAGSEIVLDAPDPVVGIWNRPAVRQVISNVIANAVKFGEEKPIHVEVTTEKGAIGQVMVRDRGIGIAAGDQARIFALFQQVASPLNVGGLGLGLTVARQVAEMHGGTIDVTSSENEGAAFRIRLPLGV